MQCQKAAQIILRKKGKRVVSPPPMTSNHLLRARRLLRVCGAAVGLVIELTAAHGAFARTAPQFEALPLVRSRQNHLLLRAFINGKPAWLTVDSGAPVSAIALNR